MYEQVELRVETLVVSILDRARPAAAVVVHWLCVLVMEPPAVVAISQFELVGVMNILGGALVLARR